MRIFTHLTALLIVLLFAVTRPVAAESQADAAELLGQAQRAVGQVVRAAQAVPEFEPSRSEAKPFWSAMKQLNLSLDKAQTGLALKDDTFFTNLATARAEAIQADIAIGMGGAGGNAALADAMKLLSGLLTALDDNYSKEAARLKQGGSLTRDEKRQLRELKKQQKELMAKLDRVERNAAKNNKEMKLGIEKIRKESEKIRKARNNVGGFVGGFVAARMMSSWMWGWHWWWGPWGAWCPGWININIIIWDDWLEAVPYDWALTEALIDVDDLELEMLDLAEEELLAADAFLDAGDFSLDDDDLREMTSELDLGWDDVDSEIGLEIMDQFESNFDEAPFDSGHDLDTFDDYGMDDFGGGFDDYGMDFDW